MNEEIHGNYLLNGNRIKSHTSLISLHLSLKFSLVFLPNIPLPTDRIKNTLKKTM